MKESDTARDLGEDPGEDPGESGGISRRSRILRRRLDEPRNLPGVLRHVTSARPLPSAVSLGHRDFR